MGTGFEGALRASNGEQEAQAENLPHLFSAKCRFVPALRFFRVAPGAAGAVPGAVAGVVSGAAAGAFGVAGERGCRAAAETTPLAAAHRIRAGATSGIDGMASRIKSGGRRKKWLGRGGWKLKKKGAK